MWVRQNSKSLVDMYLNIRIKPNNNQKMPTPKVQVESGADTIGFVFEKDRMIKKFNVDNYVMRSKIQPIDVPKRPPKKNPVEKLKERLATYHNLHKMRTDYKNYVRWYGEPSFSFTVPEIVKCSM
jgi:hypothetical protein